MSEDLLAHVRYPADLFKMQRSILGTYHVADPGTFYSGDDAWITPNDPISPAANPTDQPPYYLTMQVPGTEEPGLHAVLDVHPARRPARARATCSPATSPRTPMPVPTTASSPC